MSKTWSLKTKKIHYSKQKEAMIKRLEDDLKDRMGEKKPTRLAHSLSVARTAEQMALVYGVDPYLARCAGILHDWDKVLSEQEQIEEAKRLGIDLGVDYHLVSPLLHGMCAARVLPELYPELPASVFQAIDRHTLGNADMSDLDMVIFVADAIEPLRRDVEAIRIQRKMFERREPLHELYWTSFSQGVAYVINTERYLYPGTLAIYNELVLWRRSQQKLR